MSNDCTSKILRPLSAALVASSVPSKVTDSPTIGARCARKCFTKSTPVCCFFQNLSCPSREAVTMKSVAVTTRCVTTSRAASAIRASRACRSCFSDFGSEEAADASGVGASTTAGASSSSSSRTRFDMAAAARLPPPRKARRAPPTTKTSARTRRRTNGRTSAATQGPRDHTSRAPPKRAR
eukprot:scaffold49386_cov60-Phaeocystis_antarctica.AAC.2